MRLKSNRYKCRNLPSNYKVNARIKSKSITPMVALGVIGMFLIVNDEDWRILGYIFVGFSIYFIFMEKNETSIEFCDQFMIVYNKQKKDECLLLYYDEILCYHYKKRFFEPDLVMLDLINHQHYEFNSLDKRKMLKNVHKYIHVNQIEEDD
ncbi:MAG: hypothetical protein ACI4U3_10120 [Traorella sp.]